jgi:hypothetical protein
MHPKMHLKMYTQPRYVFSGSLYLDFSSCGMQFINTIPFVRSNSDMSSYPLTLNIQFHFIYFTPNIL